MLLSAVNIPDVRTISAQEHNMKEGTCQAGPNSRASLSLRFLRHEIEKYRESGLGPKGCQLEGPQTSSTNMNLKYKYSFGHCPMGRVQGVKVGQFFCTSKRVAEERPSLQSLSSSGTCV